MITTMRPVPPIGGQRSSGETDPRADLEPIFTVLATRWETEVRAVPGQSDAEWAILTQRLPLARPLTARSGHRSAIPNPPGSRFTSGWVALISATRWLSS
ncbi:hypothetical protein [Streptomyces sp. NPDC058657]|uniref:hypothetical protein n=1 Tax=unclassified Streptomyces TaxID=2593676 RepID=UPI00364676ED